MEQATQSTLCLDTDAQRPAVRVSHDGSRVSAYDVIRYIFRWNERERHRAVHTMALFVRRLGFPLTACGLPGGGKPTLTLPATRLDAFLTALQEASSRMGSVPPNAVAAFRKTPAATWLARRVAPAAMPSGGRRKDRLCRRTPLSMTMTNHRAPPTDKIAHCSAIVVGAINERDGLHADSTIATSLSFADSLEESQSNHVTTRPLVARGDDAIAALNNNDNNDDDNNDDDDDEIGVLYIDEDDSDDDDDQHNNGKGGQTRGTQHSSNINDDDDDAAVRHLAAFCAVLGGEGRSARCTVASAPEMRYIETHVMPTASPATPLRVWCALGGVATRICAVWPMGDGARWGISLPGADPTTIQDAGTMERADVLCMLARFATVPGVVMVASRLWTTTSRSRAVGTRLHGALALCDLAARPASTAPRSRAVSSL